MRRIIYWLINRFIGQKVSKNLTIIQDKKFLDLDLDREQGLKLLNSECKYLFQKSYSEFNGMWSEHLVFMAALSSAKRKIETILEIGTFTGETTLILSRLFPDAKIISLDLSHEEIISQGIYAYAGAKISSLNSSSKNIELKTLNSLKLIELDVKFDFIWVDGNHVSPYPAIDITNSIRLLNPDGIILCDDVYIKKSNLDKFSDLSSFQTVNAFAEANVIKLRLINKRLGNKFNNKLTGSKFLAILTKS